MDETNINTGAIIRERIEKNLEESPFEDKHRAADILVRRYGLGGEEPMSLDKISEQYDISRERVRQIQLGAISFLGVGQDPDQIKQRLDIDG